MVESTRENFGYNGDGVADGLFESHIASYTHEIVEGFWYIFYINRIELCWKKFSSFVYVQVCSFEKNYSHIFIRDFFLWWKLMVKKIKFIANSFTMCVICSCVAHMSPRETIFNCDFSFSLFRRHAVCALPPETFL